eukprot:756065-Amorphochlora_amoeboformis.AAC.1
MQAIPVPVPVPEVKGVSPLTFPQDIHRPEAKVGFVRSGGLLGLGSRFEVELALSSELGLTLVLGLGLDLERGESYALERIE